MIAVVIDKEKNLVPCEVPDPVRKNDEIIIRVAAAGLNRADLMQREGNYPPPDGWPEWPGLEVAGVVEESFEGSKWQKGDRVCALLGGGGYAEKTAVPQDLVLPVPEGLSMAEAAAIPEVFATAYLNFFMEAKVRKSETVLIQAGAGGLGSAAIQMMKKFGCRVITTVGSPEKAEFVRSLGADIAVNRKTEDLERVLEENPIDVALDCVGGPDLGKHLAKMNPWGRWILIAALGGAKAEIPVDIIFRNRIRLIGSTLRSRPDAVKAEILRSMKDFLWEDLSSGRIRVMIDRSFPLERASEAQRRLEECRNLGKVVLLTESAAC